MLLRRFYYPFFLLSGVLDVSFVVLNTVVPVGKIDYITLLPTFSKHADLSIDDIKVIVCVVKTASSYTGGSNTNNANALESLTIESVHTLHALHATAKATLTPSNTAPQPIRVQISPPIYVMSTVEYPRYIGLHVPTKSLQLELGDAATTAATMHSVWYQDVTVVPEQNLSPGNVIAANFLTKRTVKAVPFKIRLSTGGLGLKKTVVKRSKVDAQMGYKWDIRISTNSKISQQYVLRSNKGTVGPQEGIFDQLIGAPQYGHWVQHQANVLCRFDASDMPTPIAVLASSSSNFDKTGNELNSLYSGVDQVSCRLPHRYNPSQPLSIAVSFDNGLHYSTSMSQLSTTSNVKPTGTYFYTYPVVNRIEPNAGKYSKANRERCIA